MSMPPGEPDRKQQVINLTLAGVTGLVGCLTLIIVLGAVFIGLWLDGIFQSRPWFTIGLVVASIPISIIMMVIVARLAVSKIKTEGQNPTKQR
jgi:F0F1-type ATP synthase assembly protein I